MAANKYVALVSGKLKEIFGTQSGGSGNENKIVALDASGRLDITMMPVGVGASTKTVLASEAIAAGDWVNVYNNGGTLNVRKADASAPAKYANGFVLASIANGASGTVYFEGINTAVTGQTPGEHFLSTTPGTSSTTAPSAAGQIAQSVGHALSATEIEFEPGPTIEIA